VPGYPQLRVGLPAGRKLRAWWRAKRPDLVHVATEGPLGNSAVTIANELKIPVTSGFHTNFHTYAKDYGFALLRRPVLQWLRRFHNRTRRTFAPTPELCAQLSALGFENMAVLSRGVDTHDFDPERRDHELRASWGASADTPVVIHVGRMAVEKNYDLLFRVYAAMAAANPRLKFVLAGEGPLEARLKREHPECVFVGFFSRREIGRYYAAADIYVHASLTETFGNVLTEAMASGLAVAGFNYAAAKQFIVNGVNGLTVPCGEPDALVAAGVKLAKDSLLRERLRREARSAVLRQSWSEVIGGFESALLQIAGATATEPEIAVA
jgi:glycosyltransferase involved in cell wall biosynthesis